MHTWAKGLLIVTSLFWCRSELQAGNPGLALQEPEDAAEVDQAVRILKARKLSWDEKAEAMDTLLAAGLGGCGELASHLAKSCQSLDASFHKSWTRLERDFAKEASEIAEGRLNKAAMKQVEELRKTWLAASRMASLTKGQVQEVCDSAHAELKTLLDVSVVHVWSASPKLEARWTDLVLRLDDQIFLYDYWAAAREQLLEAGGAWARKSYVKKDLPDPLLYERRILAALDRAARLATVMPEKDRKTILANEADLAQLEAEEAAGILELNRIRVRAGLSALRVDLKLCDAGRGHSKDMVEHHFFAHESPLPGKKSPSDRAALAGTSGGAENIAAGQSSGHAAIRAWWYSPGHHRNMMANHGRIGLGRHQNHWTQMFG
ncbi:MAG: CAP domain-containing protein [Planctomycetes bacterium]|nr:CAP domain-containing protein [Planctomycetota bacterium]